MTMAPDRNMKVELSEIISKIEKSKQLLKSLDLTKIDIDDLVKLNDLCINYLVSRQ